MNIQQLLYPGPKRTLFFVVCVVGIIVIAATRWQYSRTITRVQVTGASLIHQSEIVDLALQVPTGTSVQHKQQHISRRTTKADINTSEIEQRIKQHPFIKNASVFIGVSDVLTVEVQERLPIAYLMNKGKQFYLDAEGRILPYRLTETVLDLPVIAAASKRVQLDSVRIANVLRVLSAIQDFDKTYKEALHRSLYQSLSEIDILPEGELQIRLAECPTPIRFGTIEHTEEKIMRLAAFIHHCMRGKVSLDDYKYIDIRWEHQIVMMPNNTAAASIAKISAQQ